MDIADQKNRALFDLREHVTGYAWKGLTGVIVKKYLFGFRVNRFIAVQIDTVFMFSGYLDDVSSSS